MTDLSITAANVVPGSDAVQVSGRAGETVAAGQVVYRSSSSGKWMKVDTNSVTVEARHPGGIALNGAADGQPLAVQTAGDITIGAALTAGVAYYASDTPGGICPVADIGSGEYVALIGLAKSTTVLAIGLQFPNVAL